MPNEPVTFDRPDRDSIDIIKDAAGRIISAQRRDHSILAYLLRIDLADHGHEASATTFLDWQLSYTSTRGMKVANYGQHEGGDGGGEKASKYLRLIRKLGRDTQKTVEFCLDTENNPDALGRAYMLRFFYLSALDKLGRLIQETRKEFDDEANKQVAHQEELR